MKKSSPNPQNRAATDRIEAGMKKISLVVSFISLMLMVAGFSLLLLNGETYTLPGMGTLPIMQFFSHPFKSMNSSMMSFGIVLLGLLPSVRILLAMWVYLASRDFKNVLVGLVVLLELMVSLRLSL